MVARKEDKRKKYLVKFEMLCKFCAENSEYMDFFKIKCIQFLYSKSGKWAEEEVEPRMQIMEKFFPGLKDLILDHDKAICFVDNFKKELRNDMEKAKAFYKLKEDYKYKLFLFEFEEICKKYSNITCYSKQTLFFVQFKRKYAGNDGSCRWSEKERQARMEIFKKYFPNEAEAILEYAKEERLKNAMKEEARRKKLEMKRVEKDF